MLAPLMRVSVQPLKALVLPIRFYVLRRWDCIHSHGKEAKHAKTQETVGSEGSRKGTERHIGKSRAQTADLKRKQGVEEVCTAREKDRGGLGARINVGRAGTGREI